MPIQVRDPVHNFIELSDEETKLVGTRALQRLRGVRQLALASLVYPGAVHTRFDHTLGVTHVAGLMADALHLASEERTLVRLAALLHDIGHGPFSHVSENALERYAQKANLKPEQKKEKIHEILTANIIESDTEILDIIGKERCKAIVKLLSRGHGQPVLKSIVSGPLDADKQDYLLRDSRFCGVQYGVFDIHQLHRSLVLVGSEDEKELMIDSDGVHAVEQFVLAKYYLTTNVYRHKVRLITDQMIVRAIILGVEKDCIPALRQLYEYDGSSSFVRNYLEWDDARFMETFGARAQPSRCKVMLERLSQRRLLKRVFEIRIDELDAEARESVMGLVKLENANTRTDIEADLAKIIGDVAGIPVDADFVILHAFDIKSVRESSRNDEEGILVAKSPQPKPFITESKLFESMSEGYLKRHVEVYAPVEWSTPSDKKRLRQQVAEKIKERLNCVRPPVKDERT